MMSCGYKHNLLKSRKCMWGTLWDIQIRFTAEVALFYTKSTNKARKQWKYNIKLQSGNPLNGSGNPVSYNVSQFYLNQLLKHISVRRKIYFAIKTTYKCSFVIMPNSSKKSLKIVKIPCKTTNLTTM